MRMFPYSSSAAVLPGGTRVVASYSSISNGPGRGWALLFWTLGMRRETARGLDALWLFLWMAPLGLWLRRTPPSLAALGTAAAALLALCCASHTR